MNLRTNLILTAIGVAITLPACGLIGVEPDEIDVLEGETGEGSTLSTGATSSGDGDGDPSNTGETGEDPTGDGDGDPATGTDTDTDTTTGDGDGDATGDGDGDATGDGDGDVTTTGETGDPCENYLVADLIVGDNMVTVADQPVIVDGSCGSAGPDAIYAFTAGLEGGVYNFVLASDEFEGALYLAGEVCDPIDELICDLEGSAFDYELGPEQMVYVVVDADMPGQGNVTITAP